jgi:hypothetical protein
MPAQALPVGAKNAILRCIIGHSAVMGVYFLIRSIEKKATREGTTAQQIARFARYFSIAPMILVTSPLLFRSLGI